MLTVATIIAIAVPLLALFLIHRLDLYATNSAGDLLVCLAWGILSTQLALFINSNITGLGILDEATVTQRIAPLVEELVKATIIAYLVYRPRFTYFVDGAIYGFAVGIGFAIVENAFYLSRAGDAALMLAGGRVLSTNLMHGSVTAISGIALALARFQPARTRRLGLALLGLTAATLVHLSFNSFVGRFSGSVTALYASAAAFGLTGALGVTVAIRAGLRRQRQMIGSALEASVRIAPGEVHAVDSLADPEAILRPIAAQFGAAKAEEVRALLRLQARLGILHETGRRMAKTGMRDERASQVVALHREMDVLRRRIGAYCMLHLRGIAPALAGSIWEGFAEGPEQGDKLGFWQLLSDKIAATQNPGPAARRWRARAIYALASALIWAGPLLLDRLAQVALPDPISFQVLLQWLATLLLFVVLDRSRRSLWQSLESQLAPAPAAQRFGRRLVGKGVRILFIVALLALSALIWLGPGLPVAERLALPPDPKTLVLVQTLAQTLVLVGGAGFLGRLRRRTWLLTSLALTAELYHRWML